MHYLIHLFLACSFLLSFPLTSAENELPPCTIVLFGASGDLTAKKLIPALYSLKKHNQIPENTSVVGFARRAYTNESFKDLCKDLTRQPETPDPAWSRFADTLYYQSSDFSDASGYDQLKALLDKIDAKNGTKGNRLYFLATQPGTFSEIVEQLFAHGLLIQNGERWSRVMLEKPFGYDLDSAVRLQESLSKRLDENQIFRIDHYLAKEGIQNLLVQRFDNRWLEPIWNNESVDHVQITMSEDIGIGTRAALWDKSGALRDSFQNHLIQMLTLVAMEPPLKYDAQHISEEKVKVLQSLRRIPDDQVADFFIRGQYGSGIIKGENVPGYHQETGVAETSTSETFVAAKIYVDTPRWNDVPFYLIGGKRLAQQTTEIALVLKPSKLNPDVPGNTVFIRIQPHAGIYVAAQSKIPGLEKQLATVSFNFIPESHFSIKAPDAYEKLFYDAIRGDSTLFVDGEEQLAAWHFLAPVIQSWEKNPSQGIFPYSAGSWGPAETGRLFGNTGHQWIFLNN